MAGVRGPYTYNAEPRAVQQQQRHGGNRSKYRDPNDMGGKANLMHDARVVRGNTYAAQVATMNQMMAAQALAQTRRRPQQSSKSQQQQQRQQQQQMDQAEIYRPSTPPPVEGRQHMTVQTDNYLEDLIDKPFEADAACQTDLVNDRPVPALFQPQSSGFDKYTWVDPGDLFDYDVAVQPILEVLVGKSLDQALLEVLEEEELKQLSEQQQGWEQLRNAAQAEAQRLEAAELRRFEEKELRLQQAVERQQQEQSVAAKAAARTISKQYLAGLEASVLDRLEKAGHFYDPVLKEVETVFMPWLQTAVAEQLQNVAGSRKLVDALIEKSVTALQERVVARREADQAAYAAEQRRIEEEKVAAVQAAEEERLRVAEAAEAKRVAAELAAAKDAEGEDDEEGDEDEEFSDEV